MSNLPSSGTSNWGFQLNEAIRRLQNKVENIQRTIQIEGLSDTLSSVVYAGSGVTSLTNLNYDKGTSTLTFEGSCVFVGETRYNFSNQICKTDDLPSANKYIYLRLNESNNLAIEARDYFSVHWKRILIGLWDGETFYDRVFTPYKTAFQHLDEENRKRLDIRCKSISMTGIETNKPTLTFEGLEQARYYADGLNYEGLSKIDDPTTAPSAEYRDLWETDQKTHEIKTILRDSLKSNQLSTEPITVPLPDSNIFRLLVGIDGSIVMQYHYNGSAITADNVSKYHLMEEYLNNLMFNDNIEGYCLGGIELARGYYYSSADIAGVTDLENLEYTFNGVPSFDSVGEELEVAINFASNNSNYTKITFNPTEKTISFDDTQVYTSDMWTNENYQTITFGSEGDTTNEELINALWGMGKFEGYDSTVLPTHKLYISEQNGLATIRGLNLWQGTIGTVELDKIQFTNKVADQVYFKVGAEIGDNTDITKNFTLVSQNDISQDYFLTANYDVDDEEYNINWKVPQFKVESISGITLNGLSIKKDSMVHTLSSEKDGYELKITHPKIIVNDINVATDSVITFMSDARHKDNIAPTALKFTSVVNNTPIVEFNYKNSDIKHIGLISQDLEKAINSCYSECFIQTVQEEEIKDCKRLKETKLVYILWKALQESNAEIQELKKEINNLKTKL